MVRFPATVEFSHLNRPIGVEWEARNLEIEGTIPAEIHGAFFRAVPDPAFPPMFPDDSTLSADGMISRFYFENGAVDHAIRYLRTPRFEAERKARKALFGRYRNPFSDSSEVQGVDRAVANTTPVWHAGRLFMTKEDALAYEVNPHTLDTIGAWTYGGKLRSPTMTAHPRIDPVTGEMFMFGYEAAGLCTADISYFIADRDGNLKSEQWFKAPYCSLMHDFGLTENHVVFAVFPTKTDLERLKRGGVHWTHDQQGDSWVGIMPRYGKVEQMRWFKGPKGVYAFHFVNAFEAEGMLHLDVCLADSNPFPFIREPSGIQIAQPDLQMQTVRWSFDLSKSGDTFTSQQFLPPGELPRLRDMDLGRPYTHFWMPSMNPQAQGPPVVGGPVGASFNCLLRVETITGRVAMVEFGPATAVSEPIHIPSKTPGHDGWLVVEVDRELDPQNHVSELYVLDATNINAPPLARVKVPVPLHPQIHGCWVPSELLAKSRHTG
jgi:carotenoid cleavage dioxygenase-like enzyme